MYPANNSVPHTAYGIRHVAYGMRHKAGRQAAALFVRQIKESINTKSYSESESELESE